MTTSPIAVAVADDEPLVRTGLRMILEAEPDITVVAEAGNGAELLGLLATARPDVVCMDVRMPGIDGIRATELVLGRPDPPRVLVVTTFSSDDYVVDALRAGASGFVLESDRAEAIVAAIRTVAAGDSLVFPESVRRLSAGRPRPVAAAAASLTPREQEVLALMAGGRSNAEIAAALVIGVETVRTHGGNLLAKLGARPDPGRGDRLPVRAGQVRLVR